MSEIDLTQLPAPKAIEEIGFEAIFQRKKSRLIELCPPSVRELIAATLELESDPLTIDLQQQAYHELLLRQRINEATAANMLALATGSDLDHIAASRGLMRQIIIPADPDANPPREAVYETDKALRRRVQMHPEKYAAAGPRAAYIAHALDADADIADASAERVRPGTVRVYIKSHSNKGRADSQLIDTVQQYLSAESRRPLCDTVEVTAGSPKSVAIRYRVTFESGPDKTLVAQKQQEDLAAVLADNSGLGASIALSKIIGALDTVGVRKIELLSPIEDVVCSASEYIDVTAISAEEVLA